MWIECIGAAGWSSWFDLFHLLYSPWRGASSEELCLTFLVLILRPQGCTLQIKILQAAAKIAKRGEHFSSLLEQGERNWKMISMLLMEQADNVARFLLALCFLLFTHFYLYRALSMTLHKLEFQHKQFRSNIWMLLSDVYRGSTISTSRGRSISGWLLTVSVGVSVSLTFPAHFSAVQV